jgi:hypothetical protein
VRSRRRRLRRTCKQTKHRVATMTVGEEVWWVIGS